MAALRSFRRKLMWRLGYRKLESKNKGIDPLETQAKLLAGHQVETILDVGANIGQSARRYRQHFPDARIHCFEPFHDAMAALRAEHAGDERIEAHEMAVGDAVATRTFNVNRSNYNHSLLEAAPGGEQFADIDHVGAIEVPVTTVDAFCAERGIDEVAILKTDTEGADLLAMQGAERMLSEGRIALVFTEALFVPIFKEQPGFHDLAAYLHGFGYRLFDFFGHRYTKSGQLRMANALFVGPASSARR